MIIPKHTIKYWAEEDRPREKLLLQGRKHVSNAELIALLLGSGTRSMSALELAKNMLHASDNNLRQLAQMNVEELTAFPGIGPAKAANLIAAFEIGQRWQSHQMKNPQITSSHDAYQVIKPKIADLKFEEFWIILLSRSLKVISLERISSGGVASVIVDPKIVFHKALQKLASAIILCHNHPSGKLKPSQPDINLTNKIIQAGKHLDITISDHIITTTDGYFSFADENLMHDY